MSIPPASLSPTKRKHVRDDDAGPSPKKSKKERKHKKNHSDEEFVLVQASLVVSIPPVFASNPSLGVQEMLDSMVMRYIPPLRGVVLTHSNLRFLQSTATVQGDSPYSTCNVGFDATVWSPRVGQRLTGIINLCSPDHVSLLVHRTFNVSIPRHHIPKTQWVFEYGPAENDPEYGVASASAPDKYDFGEKEGDADDPGIEAVTKENIPLVETQDDPAVESSGRWVHTVTGLPLGSDNATVEFTVVGLTIANQMLSLVGSIQPEPFSPDLVAPIQHTTVNQHLDGEEAEPQNDAEEQGQKNDETKSHKRKKKHAGEKEHKRKADASEESKESKRDKRKAGDTEEGKSRKRKKERK